MSKAYTGRIEKDEMNPIRKSHRYRVALRLLGALVLVAMSACSRSKDGSNSSKGFHLDIAKNPEYIGDCRPIVVIARGSRKITINAEEAQLQMLNPRIREILRYRADKVVFVRADPAVSMQDFTEVVDAVYSEADVTSFLPAIDLRRHTYVCPIASCGNCKEFAREHQRTK